MTRNSVRSLAVGASALIVFIAACGSDETSDSAVSITSPPATTATTAPATTAPATTAPATTAPATTAPATTAPATTAPATSAPATTAPTTTGPSGEGGCAELNAFVTAEVAMFEALFAGDPDALDLVDRAAGLIELALLTAPEAIRADLETMSIAYGELATALDGVDLSDSDQVFVAIESLPSIDVADAASINLNDDAVERCGFVESGLFAELPEPPACEMLDPAVAAAAAGVDVDISDVDVGANLSIPGFALNGCAYDGGTMVLTTLSFNDLELAQLYEMDLIYEGGTVLTDVDLAGLPASSLVTDQAGQISVVVFEAPTPFIVGFGDSPEPAQVVSAAEALLADQAP